MFLFQGIQGVVAVGVDGVELFGEFDSVICEPIFQGCVVGFVRVAPEDKVVLSFGIRAGDGEDAVYPAARFEAQAQQVVEGFGQIDRDFTARAVAYHGQGIGEGIGEVLTKQAGATGCLHAQRVA